MAFTTDNLFNDGDIEVILRIDSALDLPVAAPAGDGDEVEDAYDKYLASGLDEGMLTFKADQEPTRFVMRKNISLKHATRIENSKMKYDGAGGVSVQLGFIIEEVRASLKGIKNPASVPVDKQLVLKFTGDGLVDDKQMASFVSAGIIQNLYAGRQAALKATVGSGSVKKS